MFCVHKQVHSEVPALFPAPLFSDGPPPSPPCVAGTPERAARARRCGVPEDADDAKLLAAEHGTKLPDGHVVTITKDGKRCDAMPKEKACKVD